MVSICMTVKNEVQFLARNLHYHRAAGVDAFYIFDDGSTDGTLDSIREMPGVHISPSVDPTDFLSHPHLGWIAEKAFKMNTGRQVLNLHVALQQARLAGHEWIISLDADELLFLKDPLGIEGSLTRYFETILPDIETVVFLPAELVPTRIHSDHPFMQNSHFRTASRKDARTIYDPYTQKDIRITNFIGHTCGKSATRTRPDIMHQTVHGFISVEHGELRQQKAKWLLHYNISSFEHFINKYSRFIGHSEAFLYGAPIEKQRALLIKLVNDPAMTKELLMAYYQNNLLEDIERLDKHPDIRIFKKVARFFSALPEQKNELPHQKKSSIRNHVFIITYGRTGSTLLLGILNAHPKIKIVGESLGLFYQLWQSLKTLDELDHLRLTTSEDTPASPFYGITKFPLDVFRKEIAGLMDRFLPSDDTIETTGFKEIRYDVSDFENHLDFLKSHFNNTRFVFLTRDHEEVMRSGFYKKSDPERLKNYLAVIESRFENYAAKNPGECFPITYNDLFSYERVSELFTFIGHATTEELWLQAISKKHSYDLRSVNQLSENSSLVIFDSAKKWLDIYSFDHSNHVTKTLSELKLTGVIVPTAAAGALQSLIFKSATHEHKAETGISSPVFAAKMPKNPLAVNARFSFMQSPPILAGKIKDFDLIATFANAGTQTIGRLFVCC